MTAPDPTESTDTEARIRTVTGPAPLSALSGRVLAHEHLRVDLRWPVGEGSDPRRWLDEEMHVTAELTGLRKEHDVSLVVELSCVGMGRDASALARISAGSRVAVVAGTGFFCEPFHPASIRDLTVERLAERMMAEIGYGMDGTSVLPGVIGEIGTWGDQPTEREERVLRAAAQASVESGLPIATHGRAGLAQLELLMAEGVSPERVAVGQQDLVEDPAVHRKIAETGAYVSFGNLALSSPESARAAVDLIEAGHASRLLLSGGLSRMEQLRHYDGPGYGVLFTGVLPALRAAGVDEETLELVTRTNALNWLSAA
ncbi:aryldialkylphosphatase [Actinocorallia longicatena]|uniref:Phosphotriesterase-related protein n=1 Tax=Actinocorallia longicatena TaxID=111803 RepID=A0ABP6QGP5_9ACTN